MSDPRNVPDDELSLEPQRPVVSRAGQGAPWLAIGGATLVGMVVFMWMASHRPGPPKDVRNLTPSSADAFAPVGAPPPPPPELSAEESAARTAPQLAQAAPPPPPAPAPVAALPPPPVQATVVAPQANAELERRKAPSLVVDFGGSEQSAKAAAAVDKGQPNALNNDEQFAARVSSTSNEPERSHATMLRDKSTVIAQGAVIPAVLETALDSDLPGFTRAVVSRDVRSFDGSKVLVPRSSRVIGQYRSGLSQGASRAFVIWTRILRPDGVSIQIGSPGTDDLGRAGFAGSVDRHFFEQFSGAVLLSVLNAGVAAAAGQPSTQVVVGSSAGTGALAGVATPTLIPPTIKIAQGSPILIFVGKDLDFTSVESLAK